MGSITASLNDPSVAASLSNPMKKFGKITKTDMSTTGELDNFEYPVPDEEGQKRMLNDRLNTILNKRPNDKHRLLEKLKLLYPENCANITQINQLWSQFMEELEIGITIATQKADLDFLLKDDFPENAFLENFIFLAAQAQPDNGNLQRLVSSHIVVEAGQESQSCLILTKASDQFLNPQSKPELLTESELILQGLLPAKTTTSTSKKDESDRMIPSESDGYNQPPVRFFKLG